jgi:hypothetical protein
MSISKVMDAGAGEQWSRVKCGREKFEVWRILEIRLDSFDLHSENGHVLSGPIDLLFHLNHNDL